MTGRKYSVLTIDDDTFVRESIAAFLEDAGYDVLEAVDGKSGLDVFRRESPDLILVDLRMPEVDGLEVLDAVTREAPELPIIVVSGTGVLQDAVEALRLGAWDYVIKPIQDFAVLSHAVDRSIERARLLRENRLYREHLERENVELSHSQRQSEEKYRTLVETVPYGVQEMAPDGTLVYVNRAFLAMHGYAAEEVLGRRMWDISRGDSSGYADLFHRAAASQVQPSTLFFQNRCKDGSLIDVQMDWDYKRDRDGAITGFIAIVTDITERRRAEAAILEAKEAAEAANSAKSQFLANMSHELRTPLNGIFGITQLLMSLDPNEEQTELLNMIMQSSDDLLKIVSDLLDLASAETGSLKIESEEFCLREALDPLLRNFALQAEWKGLNFEAHFIGEMPERLHGDANRMKQVLVNLLGNAIKFTDSGGVTAEFFEVPSDSPLIRPENRPLDENSFALGFSVTDTGIGIPADKQSGIFESFALAEDFLTKKYGGSGLGLAISRRIANIFGGDIRVESREGEGSTFTACVIFTKPRQAAVPKAEAPPEQRKAPPAAARALNILLAEDEPVNQMFTSRILHNAGHNVTVADDGQQAVDALARGSFDLILMDIQMPNLNGLDATRLIRSGGVSGVDADIPIVGLTAYAMDKERAQGMEAGMNDYIFKPFETETVLAAIDRVIAA